MKCDCEPTVYDDGSVMHEDICEIVPWCPHEVGPYGCLMPCGCDCRRCVELSAAHAIPTPTTEGRRSAMSAGYGHMTLARCWSCQFGQCFDTPTPHPWMDDEDAEAAGIAWPLSAEDKAKHQCACTCSGQAGHHVPLTDEQADSIIVAAGAAQPEETQHAEE